MKLMTDLVFSLPAKAINLAGASTAASVSALALDILPNRVHHAPGDTA